MSNKLECPVCKAYTSAVYDAFSQEFCCPYCLLPYSCVKEIQNAINHTKKINKEGANKQLISDNEYLKIEVAKLRGENMILSSRLNVLAGKFDSFLSDMKLDHHSDVEWWVNMNDKVKS